MKRRKAASKLIPPQPPWLSWERGAADPLGVSLCPEAGCHPSKDEGGGEHVGSGPSAPHQLRDPQRQRVPSEPEPPGL